MTVRVTGTPFGDIVPEIQEALDTALAGTLNLQQQAAAWQKPTPKTLADGIILDKLDITHQLDLQIGAKVALNLKGSKTQRQRLSTLGKITFDGDWYISNNAAPYAFLLLICIRLQRPKPRKTGSPASPTRLAMSSLNSSTR